MLFRSVMGGDSAWGQGLTSQNAPAEIYASSGHRHLAKRLYPMAGVEPKDIDVCEFYDHFSGMVMLQLEDYGICGIGEGGDYVILDDPHNVEQAESENVRDSVVERIRMALPTRVRSRDGGVCVMMQRLHERDYAGIMIADKADLVHVCLPARYEKKHPFVTIPITLKSGRQLPGDFRETDGQLLWPELFDENRLSTLETELGEYARAGQLQQRPHPREGGLFKKDWFVGKYVEANEVPKGGVRVRGWDLAATDASSPTAANAAWTVGFLGRYVNKRLYIEDIVRFRGSPNKVRLMMKSIADADGRQVIIDFPQDPGQAGKSQAEDIAADFPRNRVYYSPETGDKTVRAEPPAAQAEAGNIYIVRAPWNAIFMDEITSFPGSQFADQVDAFSRAYHRACRNPKRPTSGGIRGSH